MKLPLLPVTTLAFVAISVQGHALKPNNLDRRAVSGTATVNLAMPQGTPSHLASGFIYGIPDTANQVPDHFYTDIGFRYTRAGGAQLGAPARGWIHGSTEFQNRFNSALSNYNTARAFGARVQLCLPDLWGADGAHNIAMPGDNGDWSSFDAFLTAVFTQINNNQMTPGLDIDIWNEPNVNGEFWQRNQDQYLQMWGRAYTKIRSALPNVPILGPSTGNQPSISSSWYQKYFTFIKSNNSVPDLYTWHEETPGDYVARDVQNLQAALTHYGLPQKPFMINEYALRSEQVPGSAAWYIAQLERYNVVSLRGNWASGYALHDYFGNLLGKPGANENCQSSSCATSTGYWGNGEYNVYKYYNLNMTGNRVQTTSSSDGVFDIYATAGTTGTSVKMLCGSRLQAGTWDILVTNLDQVGYPTSGSIKIHAYQFNYGAGEFDQVAVVDQGVYSHTYSNNQLVFYVSPNTTSAYAFEFVS